MSESSNVTRSASVKVNSGMDDAVDDIDESLLDAAFGKLKVDGKTSKPNQKVESKDNSVSNKTGVDKEKSSAIPTAPTSSTLPEEIWSEEYMKKMTEGLESLASGQGDQLDALLEQMMNNVDPQHQTGDNMDTSSLEEQLQATMAQFTQGMDNINNPLASMLEDLGDGEDSEGSTNMLPFIENILQQFLSKDLLYPVFSETCEKYPKWLKEKKTSLSPEEHEKYTKQYEVMRQVVTEFEKESASDAPEVKKARFNTILELLQKMQEHGAPPKDLVGEEAFPPGVVEAVGGLGTGHRGHHKHRHDCSIM